MRTLMILVPALLGLAGCAQPATECANVAAWMEMSIKTRGTPPADGAAVPEPTSLALLGLGGMLIMHRNRF